MGGGDYLHEVRKERENMSEKPNEGADMSSRLKNTRTDFGISSSYKFRPEAVEERISASLDKKVPNRRRSLAVQRDGSPPYCVYYIYIEWLDGCPAYLARELNSVLLQTIQDMEKKVFEAQELLAALEWLEQE